MNPGARLGCFEVISLLGEGGMGEVWRARDTKLGRDVAIKVLPESLAKDPAALTRFEREALAVAAHSHPNILSIFDFGTQDGRTYAVMELLEGETLRLKLASGRLPRRKAIDCAAQVARGLAAAHEKGIVHRDLKPENVFLTKDGRVKILDFGLARQIALPADAGDTESPTLARPTEPGVILGTIAYMSPEQVRGLPADHRSDIFAFGCVLYELLSGQRPFSGPSAVETMHAIVRDEPARLPSAVRETDGRLERIVRTCLAKEPGERWQSAADLARELSWLGEDQGHQGATPGATPPFLTRWLPWAVAGLVAVAAVPALFAPRGTSGAGPAVRFSIPPPEKSTIERNGHGVSFAPSPDGSTIAFRASAGGQAVLWLWSVADAKASRLADSDGANSPFWSPDGFSVAFFAEGRLKKVAVSGGPAQVLCDAPFGHAGTWGANGVILFSEWTGEGEGIHRVSASGGTATKLTLADGNADSTSRAWPSFLPDGDHFLYLGGMFRVSSEEYRVCVGRLVAYLHGAPASRLVWMDRSGRQVGSVGQPGYFGFVRISPDGQRLATNVEDSSTGGRDIWLYDLVTGIGSRLTFDPVDAFRPVWSPDGRQLIFGSAAKGPPDIYVKDLSGPFAENLVFAAPGTQSPSDWTRDGRLIAFVGASPSRRAQRQIFILPLTGERRPVPLVGNPFSEYQPRFSPDSCFVAFVSEESGQAEVYVASVDGTGRRQRVSPAGGTLPCWSPDGQELFFVAADNDLMTVQVSLGQDLRFSTPKPLFSLPPFPWRSDYDVSRDGQRFLVTLGTEGAHQAPLTVLLGWQQRLGGK